MSKKPKSRILSIAMMRPHRPCAGGLLRFKHDFGKQTEVTITHAWWGRANHLGPADIFWMAEKLLPPWAFKVYTNIVWSDEYASIPYHWRETTLLRAAVFAALYVHAGNGPIPETR
ncbi:hypothetical protein [Planktothrix phage Pra-JY27]|nr:hypothetical protein [Planktothrix phage Pag-Yong1]WEV89253.1 hypothetical protein [Synechococcus phage MinM2]